jgi:hypothetical protein
VEDWRIVMALREDDPGSLRKHLRGLHLAKRVEVVSLINPTEWPEASDRQLLLDVEAEDVEQAEKVAGDLYTRARKRAGLETQVLIFLGYARLSDLELLDADLLDRAEDRANEGRHVEAVVLAQTACEVRARKFLTAMLNRAGLEVLVPLLPRSVNFGDEKTRRLFHAATGRAVTSESWWEGYDQHRQRRNTMVHEGVGLDLATARHSVAAARAMIDGLSRLDRDAQGT